MDEFLIVPMPGAKKPGVMTKMRIQNVPCTLGGKKHDYESWGMDVVHMGTGYFDEAEVFVCRNPECMHSKVVPTKSA